MWRSTTIIPLTFLRKIFWDIIFAIIFCLITIGCGVVTVLFALQKLGKINLFKRASVSFQKEDSGSYEAPLVPGQGGVSISKVTVSNDELL